VPTTEVAYLNAAELSAAMAASEFTAVELTEATIARIERYDGDIHAICVADFDRAHAKRTPRAPRVTNGRCSEFR
jgi:amidase